MNTNITRRDFFKGSILVAMGAAGAYALAGCATPTAAAGGSSAAAPAKPVTGMATLHRGYAAAHGESCFTQIVVATAEDGTILGVSVDDYQFMGASTAGIKGVPNSDAGFAEGIKPDFVLMSKADNNDMYSALMKDKAQSTTPWLASMQAIEVYCVGKKAADLKGTGLDAVSGATLVDTPNYLAAIAEVAGSSAITTSGSYTGDGTDLKVGRTNAAAHGEKAFANAVALVQANVLVAASIDEFQFTAADASGLAPVPNSDMKFGTNYVEGKALMSKSVNSAMYSASMKDKAQATTPWLDSMHAIESAVAGQDISAISIDGPDAVSGATLVDTAGYVKTAVAAAKLA